MRRSRIACSTCSAADKLGAGAGRPVARLREEVGGLLEARRELPLVGGLARAVLDDARDGAGVEVAQPLARDLGADEGRVARRLLLVPGHLHVEVGPDAEQLGHVLVERVHQLVQLARARRGRP